MGERGIIPRADNRVELPSLTGSQLAVPSPPSELNDRQTEMWNVLWSSPVSRLWNESMDGGAVRRYCEYFDQWLDALVDLQRRGYITAGSQGQDVVSVEAQYVQKLEGLILKLEEKLGLTPMARARLGLTIAEGQKTAAELNMMIRPDNGG